MKFIKRLIWFVIFISLLGFAGSLVISKYYEGSLKAFAVQQINKQLAGEIGVDEVRLTVFKVSLCIIGVQKRMGKGCVDKSRGTGYLLLFPPCLPSV
ncbi:MAG: hypothetical protein JKY42_10825 [Flavobacteriales bacterium]|nr:hypothetical protein [Flavobacteriales bacterium]